MNARQRQLRYLYIRRPAAKAAEPARRETVADIKDFGKEFPFILNPCNPDAPGTISLVPERPVTRINHAPATRKPVNGRVSVRYADRIEPFGPLDYVLMGTGIGGMAFSVLLALVGYM